MSDTITVRADETFDEAKLAAFLRDKLASSDALFRVRQFGGGAANLTYLLDYGTVESAAWPSRAICPRYEP